MYIKVDDNGKIIATCSIKANDSFIFTEADNFDFRNYNYYLKDERIIAVKIETDEEELLEKLRYQRELECFFIINRGKLWYDNLAEEQLVELQSWYNKWLNVTETKIIPEKPSWIK